jgi:hypothetical protein
MKRILSALLALAASATLVFLTTISKHSVLAVHAHDGCSDATLTGTYGLAFSGFQIQPEGGSTKAVPFNGAGVATFGAGNVSATFASSLNGTGSTNNPYTATYTVNSDCTVSVSATPGSGGDNFVGVIVRDGAEVLVTDISDSDTLNVDFKKQ